MFLSLFINVYGLHYYYNYLTEWLIWVSTLEGENVTESISLNTYLYMFTKGPCHDRVDYLTTILSIILITS